MAYYIISFVPERMRQFQERFPFLSEATWIKDKNHLESISSSLGDDDFLFANLSDSRNELDDIILVLREIKPQLKIIYLHDDIGPKEIKAHQLTPVGGDAYLKFNVAPDVLASMLEGLRPMELNPRGNRFENLDVGSVKISSKKSLEDFRNHPKSQELERIFASVFRKAKPNWQSTTTFSVASLTDEGEESEELDLPDLPGGTAESDVPEVPEFDLGISLDTESESVPVAEPEVKTEESVEVETLPDLPPMELKDEVLEDFKDLMEVPKTTQKSVSGDNMSDKDKELSLDDLGDLELSADTPDVGLPDDSGLELSLDESDGMELSAPDELPEESLADEGMDLDLGGDVSLDDDESAGLSLSDDASSSEEDEGLNLDFGGESADASLDLSGDDGESLELGGDDGASLDLGDDSPLDLGGDEGGLSLSEDDAGLELGGDLGDGDLSDDALEKLKEIDAIMVEDASKIDISMNLSPANDIAEDDDFLAPALSEDSDLDKPLVSDDINLDSINFTEEEPQAKEDKKKKPSKESPKEKEIVAKESRDIGSELKEISGAYSGEMERLQATISNLRSDREELLAKIQKLEDEKILQNRQALTMRAELDEKKIELSIIRKKLNEENTELKDRLKLQEEKKLILEEKVRILSVELDKAGQKNKIDVKKVQMRERELEQKLELLKSDAETQIRNRDIKILELKRKIDAMEFDMESITIQEKRSVESRFELEDKLDKAIKTLRSAISALEEESDKGSALEALKKNIDM